MKLGSRSYSMFLVAAAIDSIIGTPPSWITGFSALAELESNLPMRAWTSSRSIRSRATVIACSGLAAESRVTSSSLRPWTPPSALMWSMASAVPRMIAVPPNVPQPDNGPIQPILIDWSAMAPVATKKLANAEVNNVARKCFMTVLPVRWTLDPSLLCLFGPELPYMLRRADTPRRKFSIATGRCTRKRTRSVAERANGSGATASRRRPRAELAGGGARETACASALVLAPVRQQDPEVSAIHGENA